MKITKRNKTILATCGSLMACAVLVVLIKAGINGSGGAPDKPTSESGKPEQEVVVETSMSEAEDEPEIIIITEKEKPSNSEKDDSDDDVDDELYEPVVINPDEPDNPDIEDDEDNSGSNDEIEDKPEKPAVNDDGDDEIKTGDIELERKPEKVTPVSENKNNGGGSDEIKLDQSFEAVTKPATEPPPPKIEDELILTNPEEPPVYEPEQVEVVYEQPKPTGTPKHGDRQNGMIYINGFGWIVDEGGGGVGTYADDMYECGEKIGSFG